MASLPRRRLSLHSTETRSIQYAIHFGIRLQLVSKALGQQAIAQTTERPSKVWKRRDYHPRVGRPASTGQDKHHTMKPIYQQPDQPVMLQESLIHAARSGS